MDCLMAHQSGSGCKECHILNGGFRLGRRSFRMGLKTPVRLLVKQTGCIVLYCMYFFESTRKAEEDAFSPPPRTKGGLKLILGISTTITTFSYGAWDII